MFMEPQQFQPRSFSLSLLIFFYFHFFLIADRAGRVSSGIPRIADPRAYVPSENSKVTRGDRSLVEQWDSARRDLDR